MLIPDINVLVYAFRADMPDHAATLRWLQEASVSTDTIGIPEHVFAGFLRIVTHPLIFAEPSELETALVFVEELRSLPRYQPVAPTSGTWRVFRQLCVATAARGNQIPDAYLAALAIDAGATFVTSDRGFARFSGLSWKRPLV